MNFVIKTREQDIKVSQFGFILNDDHFIYHIKEFLTDILNRKNENGEYYIKTVSHIQIGKQDQRAFLSVTIFDERGCINIYSQRHFKDRRELLNFIVGWNDSKKGFL